MTKTTLGRLSEENRKGGLPVRSVEAIVGQMYFSIYSSTTLVPAKWLTFGDIFGLYIVSVMSRMMTTFLPQRARLRAPNGRPTTHMFVWTPIRMTLRMPALLQDSADLEPVVADDILAGRYRSCRSVFSRGCPACRAWRSRSRRRIDRLARGRFPCPVWNSTFPESRGRFRSLPPSPFSGPDGPCRRPCIRWENE